LIERVALNDPANGERAELDEPEPPEVARL
jgi:hypothetical protein